jgi:hypothetical protein
MAKRRKPKFNLALSTTYSRDRIAALAPERQAQLVYDLLGATADRLIDFGFAPDLIAAAITDLGDDLTRLDGSPRRVVKPPGIRKWER